MSDSHLREFYHFLATGTQKDKNWYRPLSQHDEVEEAACSMPNDIFSFMRPNANETEADRSKVISVPGCTMYDSGGERIRGGTHDDNHDDASEINCESNENNANEKLTNDFSETFRSFSNEVINRLHNDYEFYAKSMNSFTKKLQLVQNSKPETFKKSMFSFAQEIDLSTKKGRKKKGRLIGINSTSKSRRLYKARDSSTAPNGRPKILYNRKREELTPSHIFSLNVKK